jgi:hypothetical protein
MAVKKSKSMLASYRKKQRSNKTAVTIIAAVLIVAGLVLIVLWATGNLGGGGLQLFATKTPTATATPTTTPVTPTQTPTITPTVTETPTITPTGTPDGPFAYVVQDDEYCVDIANKFNADLEVLLYLNNMLGTGCIINVGDTIQVPAPWQRMPTATPIPLDFRGTIDYYAEAGATLASVAKYFNSTIARIVAETNIYNRANGLVEITENTPLQIGQLLRVPVNIVTPVPSATPTRTMTPSPTP